MTSAVVRRTEPQNHSSRVDTGVRWNSRFPLRIVDASDPGSGRFVRQFATLVCFAFRASRRSRRSSLAREAVAVSERMPGLMSLAYRTAFGGRQEVRDVRICVGSGLDGSSSAAARCSSGIRTDHCRIDAKSRDQYAFSAVAQSLATAGAIGITRIKRSIRSRRCASACNGRPGTNRSRTPTRVRIGERSVGWDRNHPCEKSTLGRRRCRILEASVSADCG